MKSFVYLLESNEQDIKTIATEYILNYGSKSGMKLFGMSIEKVLSDKVSVQGKCYEISKDFVRWARVNHPILKYDVIVGETEDSTEERPSFHFAVKIGNSVLDLTSKQFNEKNSIIHITPLTQFKKIFKNVRSIR